MVPRADDQYNTPLLRDVQVVECIKNVASKLVISAVPFADQFADARETWVAYRNHVIADSIMNGIIESTRDAFPNEVTGWITNHQHAFKEHIINQNLFELHEIYDADTDEERTQILNNLNEFCEAV